MNLSFFYSIYCFHIITSNFIESESGVTICNQFRITRPDTWRHRASDHSTRHRTLPIPIGDPLEQRHRLTSSVTWPCDSQVPIPYRRSIVTKSLFPANFEILASKCIGVTTLTFQGHVTSSVTWPLDLRWSISYWWSFGPKSLSLTVYEIFSPKHHVLIDTMLSRHCACAISRDVYPPM